MKNEFSNLLFTELVINYITSQDENIRNEILRRLKFCNFPDVFIDIIVDLEIDVIKKRKLTFETPLCNSLIWLNLKNDYILDDTFEVFPLEAEAYSVLDTGNIPATALSLSELVAYYDEARYIIKYSKKMNIPTNMLNEAIKLGKDTDDNISLFKRIFAARFDLMYKYINDTLPDRYFLILAARFFQNELHILEKNKWQNYFGFDSAIDGCDFEPYTTEYFNFYETN